jgi:hypothetical protein
MRAILVKYDDYLESSSECFNLLKERARTSSKNDDVNLFILRDHDEIRDKGFSTLQAHRLYGVESQQHPWTKSTICLRRQDVTNKKVTVVDFYKLIKEQRKENIVEAFLIIKANDDV